MNVNRMLNLSLWYLALTLKERVDPLRTAKALEAGQIKNAKVAAKRIELLHVRLPFLDENFPHELGERLQLDPATLLSAFTEPAETLHRHYPSPPPWLIKLMRVFSDNKLIESRDFYDQSRDESNIGLLNVVAPLISDAQSQLRVEANSLTERLGENALLPSDFAEVLCPSLTQLLLPIVIRTMALELNASRLQGMLKGLTSRARFQDFCEQLRNPQKALSILSEYPVMARCVVQRCDDWVTNSIALLHRLCSDWVSIQDMFFPDCDLGRVEMVQSQRGDSHRHGQSVAIIKFTSGRQIVYKPKAIAVEAHFQELITWLNEQEGAPQLKPMKVLDRGQYGWSEFIPFRKCNTVGEIGAFYERQGAYLAILYALEATDIHYENLIACADHPFLVDLETLFHPRVNTQTSDLSPNENLLEKSILSIGLLPHHTFSDENENGIDLSGLGALAGQKTPFDVPQWEGIGTDELRLVPKRAVLTQQDNRPTLQGRNIELMDYSLDLQNGFAAMYRLILDNRHKMLAIGGPLQRFNDSETRVVLRPTFAYATLLRASYHPDIMRDALACDSLLEWLRLDIKHRPCLEKVLEFEQYDLRECDVPIFVTRPDSCDLWTSSGERIPNFFNGPVISHVREHIQSLDESDLDQQLWIIKASLAISTKTARASRSGPTLQPDSNVDNDTLVEAATRIGFYLQKRAVRYQGGYSWLGVEFSGVNQWSISPLGLSLYEGLPGIALYFSYLASVCREPRFEDTARGALKTLQTHLAASSLRSLSLGAFDGLGGIIYALTHLGVLWNEPTLLMQAAEISEEINKSVSKDRNFDVVSGSAGCLASMVALYQITHSDQVLATATALGDHLLAHVVQTSEGYSWPSAFPASAPLTGFAHGASGIGWALLELAELSGDNRFKTFALGSFDYERSTISKSAQNWPDFRIQSPGVGEPHKGRDTCMSAWCHGAPGITLARLNALRIIDSPEIRMDIDMGLSTTIREGFGGNHSLCHGDLGNFEVLMQASQILGGERLLSHVEQKKAMILKSGEEHGWISGILPDIDSLGLMTGLSGIGLGLLRIAYPENVPSVLILEPPR